MGPAISSTTNHEQAPIGREYHVESEPGYMGHEIGELFHGQNVSDMTGLDLFGLELGVSDFDAAGLI